MNELTLLLKPVGSRCNLQCSYCFYRTNAVSGGSAMTRKTADALLAKIAAVQPSALSVVFQGGEPALWDRALFCAFVKKLEAAVACPVSFSFQTNGTLLDDSLCAFLKEHAFLVGVSLDGGRQTHNRNRTTCDGSGSFDAAMRGVRLLQTHGVAFNVLCVVSNNTVGDTAATWEFFRQQDVRFLQFLPCLDTADGEALRPDAYEAFLKQSFDLWFEDLQKGRYVSVRHLDNYIGILLGRAPESCAMCGTCGHYFVVEADGSLFPCDFYCDEKHRIGSVFDAQPFALTAAHEAFIRDSFSIHDACGDCQYYPLCRGGCRRDRTDNGTRNRYCSAYRHFFNYAADRMRQSIRLLGQIDRAQAGEA